MEQQCGMREEFARVLLSANPYRAVGNRCAVNLDALDVSLSAVDILHFLEIKGFEVAEVDLVKLARSYIGSACYKRGARLREAPSFFDCSGFMKWLYAQRGIWIPRRSIQQSIVGTRVALDEVVGGDLITTSGAIDYYFDDPQAGIGHVGMATDMKTVIHAANSKVGIVETDMQSFVSCDTFRDARRIIPQDHIVHTLIVPPDREIETADDIRWIILQNL